MNSRNGLRDQQISQLDFGGVLRNSHDFEGQNLRVRDTVSAVQDYFTHYRASYNTENLPTTITYFLGTQPHKTNVGVLGDSSGSLNNQYFIIYDATSDDQYYVWYNVSGGGTDPALVNATGIEVPIQTNDDSTIVAYATELAISSSASRIFDARRKGNTVLITTKKFGETSDSINGTTAFLISNTSGEEKLIEEVKITYNDNNPIYEGQELVGYKYNIFTGKFELLSNPPDVQVDFTPVSATEPTILNITLTANVENSFVLPENTNRFYVKARTFRRLRLAYEAGETATNYITIPFGTNYSEDGLQLDADRTVYLLSTTNNVDVEIVYWI